MKLKDMKLSKAERKKRDTVAPTGPEPYPWGLRIHIDNDSIDKFPELKGAKAGTRVSVQAVCKVSSVSMNESDDGRAHHSVELQIQKMAVSGMESAKAAFNEDD